jgi:hypothetical protein
MFLGILIGNIDPQGTSIRSWILMSGGGRGLGNLCINANREEGRVQQEEVREAHGE